MQNTPVSSPLCDVTSHAMAYFPFCSTVWYDSPNTGEGVYPQGDGSLQWLSITRF